MVTELLLFQNDVLGEVVITQFTYAGHQLTQVGMATRVGRQRHLFTEMPVHGLDVVGHEHAIIVM